MKFLCDNCKAKYQIGDDKVAGKTVRMKCRKCGHLIEVSANVTESSVAQKLTSAPAPETNAKAAQTPAAPQPAPSAAAKPKIGAVPAAPRPPAPSAPRAGKPAPTQPSQTSAAASKGRFDDDEMTSVMQAPSESRPSGPSNPRPAAGRPAAGSRPSSLSARAGAFAAKSGSATVSSIVRSNKSATAQSAAVAEAPAHIENPVTGVAGAFVQALSAEPTPAPASGPSLATASDDWYVGIAGVPVGPIRLADLREKAQSGQVDGESLVWREGFDEWQPLRTFPELLELVTEAQAHRSSSMGNRRHTSPSRAPSRPPPAAAAGVSMFDPAASPVAAPGSAFSPHATAPAASATSTPSTTGGAAARPGDLSLFSPAGAPVAAPAAAPSSDVERAPNASTIAAPDSVVLDRTKRRNIHPMAYAVIGMASVFGGVAAWALFFRETPVPTVVVHAPTATAQSQELGPSLPPPPPVDSLPTTTATAVAGKAPASGGAPTRATAAAPTAEPGGGYTPHTVATPPPEPPASGQLTPAQIQSVVSANQPLIKRQCWQPALDSSGGGATSARVNANIVIGPSGAVESASARGAERDFPGLSSCIAARVKKMKFPPSGGSQPVSIPFVFAGQ